MAIRTLSFFCVFISASFSCTFQTNKPTVATMPEQENSDTSTPDSGVSDTAVTDTATITSWHFGTDTVTVEITEQSGLRTYSLTTTHPQRDEGPTQRTFSELPDAPILRSGNDLTDALFAMAIKEVKENSVSVLQDGAFQNPRECECFETGELWNWVWTRDIAYATELSLGWLDPQRAKNSLLFKLSAGQTGQALQIVQDTGTGGSWPISTDRVAWVRGAMTVLKHLDDPEFEQTVITALRNTAEIDKKYVYDQQDGLYFGETSFLDWRAQTYPNWMATDANQIAMSKSLSTNLNHLYLLRSLETLTAEDHGADALADAIDQHFWMGNHYSSYKSPPLTQIAVNQQDLLATALAIIDLGTHPEALEQYPHSTKGAPVIFPQQQRIPIYHNRAIWPFVSSYAILAARKANNGAVFAANLDSIISGAALNLSHMENLEWQTGSNWVSDDQYSGPVVNSRRQLWSVAGFVGAIVHGVFGLDKVDGTWQSDPILPEKWFTPQATLTLDGVTFAITSTQMAPGRIAFADQSTWQNLYAAVPPTVELTGVNDQVTLDFYSSEPVQFNIYRDGNLIAENASSPWEDTTFTTTCYTVTAQLTHTSSPSAPTCWWGDNYERIQIIPISDFEVTGGTYSTNHGRPHYQNWGEPTHRMTTTITANHTGNHYVQLTYGNGSNTIDTGITASVKWLVVTDSNGEEVASGPLVMAQIGDWEVWQKSTLLPVSLNAGEVYSIAISDGFNMSYLSHYDDYNFSGGGNAPYNYVNITEMLLLAVGE